MTSDRRRPASREEHREVMLAAVERQGTFMASDGDWSSVLLLDAGRVVMMIDGGLMPLLDLGDELHRALLAVTEASDATYFCRVISVWLAPPPTDRKPVPGDARNSPDRKEMVIVALGDAEGMEVLTALITRSSGPPTLGPWEPATATRIES